MLASALLFQLGAWAQHPSLLLTSGEVSEMKAGISSSPLFSEALNTLQAEADAALAEPVSTPVPCDGGGGVVHEKHKSNYYAMFHLGLAYQFTGDKRYARKAADIMLAYAKLYPTIGLHPLTLSNVRGRLFWQTLNESVFLVHTAAAYDCIEDVLTEKERRQIEKGLLLNMADFIENGYKDYTVNHVMFNRMHNHATWATAAVGMTGLATGHNELVRHALYGSDGTGKHGGFLQQMDELFSPDGYYTEGAYYERYALWPFVIFAQCLSHTNPELNIFERRGQILRKALGALVQMSYEGEFFHINDALEKGLSAQELVYAIDILYNHFPSEKQWLTIINKYQHHVLPIMGGYRASRDIAEGQAQPLAMQSQVLHDGSKGDNGGLAIIRPNGSKLLNTVVTLKATSQGMGHGHFDKLTLGYYDNGHEILTDYGASRFLNIEAKHEGHYTKENDTYAKQTVAHNTVVVDGRSDFNGDLKTAQKFHSDIVSANLNGDCQTVVAQDTNAYPGVTLRRAVVLSNVEGLEFPVVIDVFKAVSSTQHQYDYPLWYNGTMVSANFPYEKALTNKSVLGTANGYQHIWLDAWGQNKDKPMTQFTFFNGTRFYTVSMATTPQTEMKFISLGANDPDFNLLDRHGIMFREKASSHTFAVSIEPHGHYDVVMETSADLKTKCESITILEDDDSHTVVKAVYAGKPLTVTVNWKGEK